jgi:glycosyltransferase involved in cell wall biosynthesis
LILVNFSNQIAAGPKNISLNFIKLAMESDIEFTFILPDLADYRIFSKSTNVKFIYVSFKFGVLGSIFKALYINYFLMPKLLSDNSGVNAILAFGNFLSVKSDLKKVVLLHHPYIVDDSLFKPLPLFTKIVEFIKRLQFKGTTKNVDTIIAQSEYMKTSCESKYQYSKGKVVVIPNPISANFKSAEFSQESSSSSKFFNVLYVSRFYPHKNHQFVLTVAEKLAALGSDAKLIVTVDPLIPGSADFFERQVKMNNVVNLGEVSQEQLIKHYKECSLFFFPSKAETFGNPIIEAMFYAKPLLLPNLDYAKSIADGVAVFYESDDVDDCVSKIVSLSSDLELLKRHSLLSESKSKSFLDSERWYKEVMNQLVNK